MANEEFSDKENIIVPEDERDEETELSEYNGHPCCNPSHALHRFFALIFMCLLGFGSYFCYDNPGALQDNFIEDMKLTTSQFVYLYSWYSWPNVVLCFVGGFLIDRVFGIRLGTVIYATFVLIGQIIFALGGVLDAFWLMVVGRFVFGIGGESLAVAQNSYAVLWFKGKELNMVFGLQLSFARVGSTVNFVVMEHLYKLVNKTYQGYMCTGVVLFIAATTCVMSLICGIILGVMDRRAERILKRKTSEATVYAFEGVPYARPPVGELRFKDPEEPEAWTGIRNAASFGPNCIQKTSLSDNTGSVHGEEDCLFLNIYTVDPPNLWKTVKRPVIVFLHGGGFVFGSGNTQGARPDPLLRRGLIFVKLNYRLGVMGFLNTEDAEAPGNAALKDQTMALRWVQANIAAFGGDPRNVAIMGESAGAASVNYHMISPLSKGLFQRAIGVSGTLISRWAAVDAPRQRALALRRLFAAACPDLPEAAIAPCLRRVNASALVDKQFDIPLDLGEYHNYFLQMTFMPSVEAPAAGRAPFLAADPVKLLEEGRVARVPYLTGFTTGEGLVYLWFAKLLPSQEPSRWGEVDSAFARIFRWDMPQGLRTPEATREVRSFYLGNRSLRNANDSVDTVERFQKMCTDIFLAVGISKTAELLTKNGGSVYVYQFSRDGPLGIIKQDMGAAHIPGVTHGDDMAYLFDFMNQTANEPFPVPSSEVPLRERQQKIFANFAKLGHPTPDGSGLVQWPLYTLEKESYLDMDQELSAKDKLLGRRITFWRNLAKKYNPSEMSTPSAKGKKLN